MRKKPHDGGIPGRIAELEARVDALEAGVEVAFQHDAAQAAVFKKNDLLRRVEKLEKGKKD